MAFSAPPDYRMLSALFIGALVAGLSVLTLSVAYGTRDTGSGQHLIAQRPTTASSVRVSLDLQKTRQPALKGIFGDDVETDTLIEPDRAQIAPALAMKAATVQPAAFRVPDPASAVPSRLGKVAIIIDDLGHNHRHNTGALSLPPAVAFALLPYTRHSKTLAEEAREQGHELIVHMPMQPKNPLADAGPHALFTSASADELRATIVWNLEQFEGYYAVNNHMGSLFTENETAMRILFEELASRGLAFYDSRTTAASSSVGLAASLGVSLAERDVFLDNQQEAIAVDKQLATLERLARKNGSAIAIGHPHAVTFDQINLWAQTLEGRGLVLVPPSTILAERRTPYWRSMVRTVQNNAAPATTTTY
ncbi:MAG: divergent polysaccharide deacetylase family protein [Pseudomonadota bacterium]